MNISIAIADTDREYVERLSEVLQQYNDLTIRIFTSAEKLKAAMEGNHIDVVLFDPDISGEMLVFPGVKLPMCLYSDESRNRSMYADFAKVAKYQRISNIYKELVREYADKAGYSADFNNMQNTKLIAVYSPVGGSGKTTVALSLASKYVSRGKTALFLSMEQLCSSSCVNPKLEEGITALVAGAADEHVNFELKLKGLMKQGMNGMFYLEGFERIVDYDAVTGGEMEDILDRMKRCNVCDILVVDMESALDSIGKAVLDAADKIVIVEKTGELSNLKMNLFAQQALVAEYENKMVTVRNFAENNSVYSAGWNLPVAGLVHNYGNLPLKNILQAIVANDEVVTDKI